MSERSLRNPELGDPERSELSPQAMLLALSESVIASLTDACDGFERMEQITASFDLTKIRPQVALLIPNLRVAIVKAISNAQSMMNVALAAKIVGSVGDEDR